MVQTTTKQTIANGEENWISEVTVFTKQAQLKRQVLVNAEAGLNCVFVELNAFEIDPDSIQANVYGNVDIISVQYREILIAPKQGQQPEQTDASILQQEQQRLEQHCNILRHQLETYSKQEALLDSTTNFTKTQNPVYLGAQVQDFQGMLSNLQSVLTFTGSNYMEISHQKVVAARELQQATEQLALVKAKLTQKAPVQMPGEMQVGKTVEILFDSQHAEAIKIEVAYIASYATWKPFYRVDINTDLSRIAMTMFAHIEQATGEDWQGVTLGVSNIVPTAGTVLPTLNSWRIGTASSKSRSRSDITLSAIPAPKAASSNFAEETSFLSDCGLSISDVSEETGEVDPIAEADVYIAYGRYQQAETLLRQVISANPGRSDLQIKLNEVLRLSTGAATIETPKLETEQEKAKAKFKQAQEIKSSLAFDYQVLMPVDINSGGDETILPMFTKYLKSDFFYYAVPKQNSLVYMVCRADLESSFLSGKLNIHIGGRFVGNTFLDEKKAGKDLLINLGSVHDVKIQREKTTDELAESILGGMMDRLSIARMLKFRIVIENLKDEVIRIEILDAIPVATTDRIQIKNVVFNPTPTTVDWQHRKGVMLWNLNIPAKETQEIHTQFFIKYPKNHPPELE